MPLPCLDERLVSSHPHPLLRSNPWGRTGISSRGLLGRWGPNHAADPVVTRWKRDAQGKLVKDSAGNKILQFVAVKRSDNGQWALPGVRCVGGHSRREDGNEGGNARRL